MSALVKSVFRNRRISPRRRVLSPFFSAIISFFLPGAAQAINGQTAKGLLTMLFWLAFTNLGFLKGTVLYNVIKIIQYLLMALISSDAYFIASRMKLGEEVRTWSVLFYHMEMPTAFHHSAGSFAGGRPGRKTLISGATLIDGTGRKGFLSDVLLEDGVIRLIRPHIERKEKEYVIVEGEKCILVPGFINPCSCNESTVFDDPEGTAAVRQGFTTEMIGQNGQSLAPIRETQRTHAATAFRAVHGDLKKQRSFDNIGMYLLDMERLPAAAHLDSFIGYGTLRSTMLGMDDWVDLGEGALETLCSRVRSGIASGAKGISIGLAYAPCSLAGDKELESVMRTAAQCGGVVSFQLPLGEGTLLPAFDRIGLLAQKSGAPVMIAGIHAIGSDRTLGGEICRRVDILRSQGVQLFLSVTGMPQQVIGLSGLTPAKMWNGAGAFFREANGDKREMLLMETAKQIAAVGGASSLLVRSPFNESTGGAEMLPLDQAAEQQGYTPEEFIFQQLCRSDGETAAVLLTEDCDFAAQLFSSPYTSLCTDGQMLGMVDYTLPHFLGRYVQKMGILSMEDAVHRCTMAQADFFGLWDRGLIREGMIADIVLMKPALFPVDLDPKATRGIVKVWVGGSLQYDTDPHFDVGQLTKPKFFGIQMET
ncbi:hypothetical protein CE91St46_26800 [Eubacteriales bacterium]|nr:amidohydrolase family protein [Faecalicatena sp. BF-R-105]GKH51569.1 hypothetical protein CE91St46_26800 [Eubacteriales bacterium]GKH64288.1 hypothetical protein CE91St47_27570 [Eubacteriales bacterium]